MIALTRSSKALFVVALFTPLLTGASADGCGSDVSLGGDDDEQGCEVDGVQYAVGEKWTPDEVGACPNSCGCMGNDGSYRCTEAYCGPISCFGEDGTQYEAGQTFPSPDGCNTCSCGDDGSISCTAMGCDPDPGGCNYDGQHYEVGESFPSTDGCNSCSCVEDGAIGCTEIGCVCDPTLVCAEILGCFDGLLYPSACGPANCDEPIGPCNAECDPTLACGEALSCFEGQLYPTTCGPANCDEPIGPCDAPPCDDPSDPDCPVECDPTLGCAEVESCYDGLLYPTGCGPANCDDPIGECPEPSCDPTLLCGDAPTCFDGLIYPTTCGPTNCDEPLGPCEG